MPVFKLFPAVLAYVAVTWVIFGDPIQPIDLAMLGSDRLGVPNWRWTAVCSIAGLCLIFAIPLRSPIAAAVRPPIFVILAVLLPTLIVGLRADVIRHRAVLAFGPDEVREHSFFESIREAPKEFQFFLHTGAIRNCTPYAWSYRALAFYEVPLNAAINVLPDSWLKRCGITRTK